MRAYSITYDLKHPGRDYSGLYVAIKSCGPWWHYLESTWIVVTNETSVQVWNRIAPTIDKNDFLLIIEVKNNKEGWLPNDAWDWLNQNIPNY